MTTWHCSTVGIGGLRLHKMCLGDSAPEATFADEKSLITLPFDLIVYLTLQNLQTPISLIEPLGWVMETISKTFQKSDLRAGFFLFPVVVVCDSVCEFSSTLPVRLGFGLRVLLLLLHTRQSQGFYGAFLTEIQMPLLICSKINL